MSREPAHKPRRRVVPADLIETTPDAGATLHWALAAPLLLFLAWIWVDVFTHYSPVRPFWLDVGLAALAYAVVFVLPLGVAAHRAVTAAPRLFQHAGWDPGPSNQLRRRSSTSYVIHTANGGARLGAGGAG